MKNITYLFGAGASANSIPVVNQFRKKINEIVEKFENDNLANWFVSIELIEEFRWLAKICSENSSFDTYAKILFLKKDWRKLNQLKVALSAFLMFVQKHEFPDLRYSNFLASILNIRNDAFPNNLKIISWNYDNQLELAYSQFIDNTNLETCQDTMNFQRHFNTKIQDLNKFAVYKLNGTSGLFDRKKNFSRNMLSEFHSDSNQFSNQLSEQLNILKSSHHFGYESSILFSWENENNNHYLPKVIEGTSGTKILIVIGYSFPFFNREVDRKIINAMANLEKVYFQSKEAHVIKERFSTIREDIPDRNLICYDDCSQFLLPKEL